MADTYYEEVNYDNGNDNDTRISEAIDFLKSPTSNANNAHALKRRA
jgi:hypothetical protein